jgi:hypothetical protein
VRIVAEFTLEVAERLSPEILVMAMMSESVCGESVRAAVWLVRDTRVARCEVDSRMAAPGAGVRSYSGRDVTARGRCVPNTSECGNRAARIVPTPLEQTTAAHRAAAQPRRTHPRHSLADAIRYSYPRRSVCVHSDISH